MKNYRYIVVILALLTFCLLILPSYAQEVDTPALQQQAKSPDALVRWRAVAALQWVNTPASIDTLLRALKDPDSRVKKTAARALGRFGDRGAIVHLIPLLSDPDLKAAAAAAEALGHFADPTAVHALITTRVKRYPALSDAITWAVTAQGPAAVDALASVLKNKDPYLREWAVETLGWIQDPRVTPLLVAALADKDRSVRSRTGSALAYHHEAQSVNALIAAYRAEEDESQRESFLINLAHQHDSRALPVIIDALRSGRSRNVARMVLPHWGPEGYAAFIAALRDKNQEVQDVAADALAFIGDPRAIPALAAALTRTTGESFAHLDGGVYGALVGFGSPVCDPVFARINDPAARSAALQILAVFHDPRAFQPLMLDLRNEDRADQASISLGLLGDQRAIPALIAMIKEPSPWGHQSQFEALGELKASAAVPYLIQELKNEDEAERVAACEALGKIGDPRAIEPLRVQLTSQSEMVRHAGAMALASLKDPQVIPILTELLKHQDAEIVSIALNGLKAIGSDEAMSVLFQQLQSDNALRRVSTISTLQEVNSPQGIAAMKVALQDKDPRVRSYAARAICNLAPQDAVPLLLPLLTEKDTDREIEEAVIRVLYRLHGPLDRRMADPLLTLLEKPDAGRQSVAAVGLGVLKETRAVSRLISLAETAPSVHVRGYAIRALGEIGDARAVPVLLACLSEDPPGDCEPDLRTDAARALGGCHDQRAVEPLILCLQDAQIRNAAAKALGMIGDHRAQIPLEKIVQSSAQFPIPVAGALAELGNREMTTRLLDILQHDSRDDREAAAWALMACSDARIDPALIAVLQDRRCYFREVVAFCLGQRRARQAIPVLIGALQGDHTAMQDSIYQALTTISGQDFGTDREKWQAWWDAQVQPVPPTP